MKMEIFNTAEEELFRVLASLSQEALRQSMSLFLQKQYKKRKVKVHSQYVYAIGNIPICLVAHLDTVHRTPIKELYFDKEQDVMWSPQGIGADDRAGVFAIVEIIKKGYRPHIILTTDEEKGCVGASELAKKKCPFKDIKYFIQIDRQGKYDCVFYDCDNKNFEEYIESFGFITDFGSFSDIAELCPTWGIAGVNLSSGYYNEHTLAEYLKTKELKETISKIEQMLDDAGNVSKFKYIPATTHWYDYINPKFYKVLRVCYGCKKLTPSEEMLPVIMPDKTKKYYCGDCLCSEIGWCESCGEAFKSPHLNAWNIKDYCPICKENMLLEEGGILID